jgi:hypothetical protein
MHGGLSGRGKSPKWAFAGVLRATASALKAPRGRRRRCQIQRTKLINLVPFVF